METADVHGPIDFVLIEFQEDRLTGGAAQALLDVVEKGIVTLYDVLIVGKAEDGSVYAIDLDDAGEQVGTFSDLAWVRSGLLTEEDMRDAANAMEAGTLAVLIVYENTWAVPFVAAARASGGELVASARIPAQDIMDALDALEAMAGLPAARRSDTPEEADMPRLLRMAARTAVVAGTATAVSGRVQRRQAEQVRRPAAQARRGAAQPQEVPPSSGRRPRPPTRCSS